MLHWKSCGCPRHPIFKLSTVFRPLSLTRLQCPLFFKRRNEKGGRREDVSIRSETDALWTVMLGSESWSAWEVVSEINDLCMLRWGNTFLSRKLKLCRWYPHVRTSCAWRLWQNYASSCGRLTFASCDSRAWDKFLLYAYGACISVVSSTWRPENLKMLHICLYF